MAVSFDDVVSAALTLPEVTQSTSYNTPSLKVKGKIMGRLRTESEGALALRCDFLDREMLMQADPSTFFITDHLQQLSHGADQPEDLAPRGAASTSGSCLAIGGTSEIDKGIRWGGSRGYQKDHESSFETLIYSLMRTERSATRVQSCLVYSDKLFVCTQANSLFVVKRTLCL